MCVGGTFRERQESMSRGKILDMKLKLMAAIVVSMSASLSWGWDVEHDELAELTCEFLPADVRAGLVFDDFGIIMANCHFPDWMHWPSADGRPRYANLAETEARVGKVDVKVLAGLGYDSSGWFASPEGMASVMAMLSRAFARGEHEKAAFYISILTHLVGDEGGLNHTPILQFIQYSKMPGVDYPTRKVEKGAKNMFGFRSDGPVMERVRAIMRGCGPTVPKGKYEDVVFDFVADSARQSAFAAEVEGRIGFGAREEAEKALAELVAMQVRILENMIAFAWEHRSDAAPLPGADFAARIDAERWRIARTVDPRSQFVFHGVFDESLNPPDPKGIVAIVCEPYVSPKHCSFSYVGRMLSAAAARTLRDNGYAVSGISLWEIEKGDVLPDPKSGTRLFVAAGVSGRRYNGSYMGPTAEIAAKLRAWREAGGALIYVGGDDPFDITGLGDRLELRANEEVPASEAWAGELAGDWTKMSVWVGGKNYRQQRSANINGFCKPVCRAALTPSADVVSLAELSYGSERFTVSGRRANVTWVPVYLLMPFLYSPDTALNWSDMRLDSFASSFLMSHVLGCSENFASKEGK